MPSDLYSIFTKKSTESKEDPNRGQPQADDDVRESGMKNGPVPAVDDSGTIGFDSFDGDYTDTIDNSFDTTDPFADDVSGFKNTDGAPSDGASGGGKPETEPKHQFPFLSKLPGSNKDKPKNIIERPSISGSETLSVSNIESSKKSTAVPHLMGNKELSRPSKVDAPFHRGGFLFKQKSTATGPKETEVVTTEPTLTSDKDGVCEPPFVSSPSAIVGDNKEGTPSKSVPAVTPYTANKASVPDSGTVRLQSKNIIDTTNHHGWSPDIGDDVMDRGVSDSNTVPDATDIAPTINFDEVYGAFLSNVRDSSDHSTSLEATILDLRVLLSNAQSDMLLMRARQASLADEMEAALESIEEVSLEAPETREDNGNTNSGD